MSPFTTKKLRSGPTIITILFCNYSFLVNYLELRLNAALLVLMAGRRAHMWILPRAGTATQQPSLNKPSCHHLIRPLRRISLVKMCKQCTFMYHLKILKSLLQKYIWSHLMFAYCYLSLFILLPTRLLCDKLDVLSNLSDMLLNNQWLFLHNGWINTINIVFQDDICHYWLINIQAIILHEHE